MTAGLKTAASQLAVKTAEAKGNVFKGLKRLREKGSVKTIFTSMAKAGLISLALGSAAASSASGAGESGLLDLSGLEDLPQRFIDSAVKSTISMALDITVDGIKPSQAMKTAARSTVADVVCGTLANKLGQQYRAGGVHYVPHKLMHAAIGGAFAKIQGKDPKAGALAAFAEAAAEAYRTANPDKFGDGADAVDMEEYAKASTFAVDIGRLTAATMATALNLDAATSAEAGANSVQNNIVGLAITAGMTAYAAYEVYEAYQEGGAEAAGRKLVELGIISVVGGTTVAGLRVGFKVAGKVFPTAAAAFESIAGQILKKAETGIGKFTSKVQGKLKGWLGNRGLPVPSNLPKSIHLDGQGKHIVGHKNYAPLKGRSILTADSQKLLDGVHRGKYRIIRIINNKPIVNFVEIIGTYGPKNLPTRYGVIHHGRKGAHIVPANPKQY